MSDSTDFTPHPPPWFVRHYPLLLGVLGLLPFVIYSATIAKLFWFGDDFDLVGQINRVGLWTWIAKPWVESYSPVFKFVWGSSVFVFHGSYFAMLALVWVSHAIAVVLFGYLLRLAGFGWMAVASALAIVGLAWTNVETLCWSVQLSPTLANMFFVAAVLIHVRYAGDCSLRVQGWIVLCIAASALCYSRGVLSGVVLATMCFVPLTGRPTISFTRRATVAVAYLLPSIAVTAVIMRVATGNQQAVLAGQTDKFAQMLLFGLWYFCLNPFYYLLKITSWGPSITWMLGAAKIALIVATLWKSRGRERWLLTLLLLFDLGNAALLGLGRYHTGLRASVSSRYQYCALLATIPFVGFWLEWLLLRAPAQFHFRSFVAAAVAAVLAFTMLRGWRPALEPFVYGRGTEPRAVLLSSQPLPANYQTPGIPGLPPDIARGLIARYHLH